jgi:hypothetical protein
MTSRARSSRWAGLQGRIERTSRGRDERIEDETERPGQRPELAGSEEEAAAAAGRGGRRPGRATAAAARRGANLWL